MLVLILMEIFLESQATTLLFTDDEKKIKINVGKDNWIFYLKYKGTHLWLVINPTFETCLKYFKPICAHLRDTVNIFVQF